MKSINFCFLFSIIIATLICISNAEELSEYEGIYNIIVKNNFKKTQESGDFLNSVISEIDEIINNKKDSFKEEKNFNEYELKRKNTKKEDEGLYTYKLADVGDTFWLVSYLNPTISDIISHKLYVTSCQPDYHIVPKQKEFKCRSEVKGYPCCPPEVKEITYVDIDGDWGFNDKTDQWCGFTPYFESKYTYM